MKLFKFYVIPVLMLVISILQMTKVEDGLSRWKGGGFGMYSDYHPISRQLLISGSYISNDSIQKNRTLSKATRSYLYYPRPKFAEIIKETLDIKDTVVFEIWQPYFDFKNEVISKKIIHSYKAK